MISKRDGNDLFALFITFNGITRISEGFTTKDTKDTKGTKGTKKRKVKK